jgi:TonB family protein
LLFILFVSVVYLAAAARIDPLPQHTGQIDAAAAQYWNESATMTTEEAANLQAEIEANPENLEVRTKLLFYFRQHLETNDFASQVLWFVQYHPDSQALTMVQFPHRVIAMQSPGSISELQQAWEHAIAATPNSPDVLLNAGRFFTQEDPERALSLLRDAQAIDSAHAFRYAHLIAEVYVVAEMALLRPNEKFVVDSIPQKPELAAKLNEELEASDDPALLSRIGTMLSSINPGSLARQQQRGLDLIQRAIDLDPSNPAWKEAFEYAKGDPVRQRNYENLTHPIRPGAIRISQKGAEANLVEKVEAVYPPQALALRIQGSVEFNVTIGEDGHIQELQFVRGHPLLTKEAKEALLKYVYRPTLLNGKPVAVNTTVTVPFKLD